MNTGEALRRHLVKLLDWRDAHVGFDAAIEGIPADMRGVRPSGLPYSAWELLEHLRRAQADILDFCHNPKYEGQEWPDAFWPETPEPPSSAAWESAVAAFRADRKTLVKLCKDPELDLFARIPHGSGQTYLREFLLVADHNAYHVGELVVVRRLLGTWKTN